MDFDKLTDTASPGSDPVEYRKSMEKFTCEAAEIIANILSEADFKSSFPHVFGDPDELGATVRIQNKCGLFLLKAQLHTSAILMANQRNNLHSMAIQSRVVMECAATIISWANLAVHKSEKDFKRMMDVFHYETVAAIRVMAKGNIDLAPLHSKIVEARKSVGDERTHRPKRVTISDRLEAIVTGHEWYDFLSERFFHSDSDTLMDSYVLGGVRHLYGHTDDAAFGFFLDYISGLLFLMIGGYGLLLSNDKGRDRVFNEAFGQLDEKRMAAQEFMGDWLGSEL
ncbi:hypothetical protein F4X73_08180 [Candidatus Poribacteria bacterium]|nr:hypothetical protein [Gemmatimonadota bacterium]MDE2739749.1 hypothetical protein [Paracoccaceae bacterium]MYB64652.1 hypothetical protein [Candidatus Poribacteria bacterium]